MNQRLLSTLTVAALTVTSVACSNEASAPVATIPPTVSVAGSPPATIATDLPPEIVGHIGPVAVLGDVLPPYDQNVSPDPAIGMQAPVLNGVTYSGKPLTINGADAERTLVFFLAHWCPACNKEVPEVNDWSVSGNMPNNLRIMAVSTNLNPQRPNFPPAEWLANKGWGFPTMADGVTTETGYVAANAFGITGFPSAVLLDENGKVLARWSGPRGAEQLAALVAAAG